jgi:hypothetical protein
VDSNFIAGDVPFSGGWCWRSWRSWNETFYPSGGNLSALLGHAPMALYVSAFCNDTVHRAEGFDFVSVVNDQWGAAQVAVAHPDSAHAFYTSILSTARAQWGMQQLFTDFLCWRGAALASALPGYFGAGEAWLGGMARAAQDLGMEVQFCMACGHQALLSLQWPAVTNARGSGDGGAGTPGVRSFTFSSVMAALVGLGWSKDNLRLRIWDQGDTELQTLLAALSLGPVGLSDQLEGFPAWPAPGAGVVTNVTLALSLCAANGTLLTPSFPLTPVEPHMAFEGGLGNLEGNVYATFTVVGGGAGSSPAVWFTALGFTLAGNGSQPPATFELGPQHLAPLVDFGGAINPPDFADIPMGAFLGAGDDLPGPYVAWDARDPRAVVDFNGTAPFPLALAFHAPQQVNVAPVFACGGAAGAIALLGERGKAAAVSTFRFSSVAGTCGAGELAALAADVRGAPGEVTALLYATRAAGGGWVSGEVQVTMGADGTAAVRLGGQ